MFSFFTIAFLTFCSAATLTTNSLIVVNAPTHLSTNRLEKLTDEVERLLEWKIRRVTVRFYSDSATFATENHLGSNSVVAFTKREDTSIHMGPHISADELDGVLTHELSHAVIFQKYKSAVPTWLEEGLANYVSQRAARRVGGFRGRGVIDYKWLATQNLGTFSSLAHPLGDGAATTVEQVRARYAASTALIELLESKCGDILALMQIALGRRLEPYIKNTCEIADLDLALRNWIKRKATAGNELKRQLKPKTDLGTR